MSEEIQSSGPDLAAIADRLYASPAPTTPTPAPTPAAEAVQPDSAMRERGRVALEARVAEQSRAAAEKARPTDDASIAERMWGDKEAPAPQLAEVPDAIKTLRDDPLRRMFSPQGSFASVQLEESMAHLSLDPAVKTAAAAEFREVFADFGASPQDAKELVDTVTRFGAEPMTTERDATNTNSAIQILNEHYGTDAKAALATAQEMIARDPRIARMLDTTRLGNDPQTVLKLVQLARSAKMRGEF